MQDGSCDVLARALSLLTELHELPIEQRQARIDEVCAGDEELHAEVMSLLEHASNEDGHAEAGGACGRGAGFDEDWLASGHDELIAEVARAMGANSEQPVGIGQEGCATEHAEGAEGEILGSDSAGSASSMVNGHGLESQGTHPRRIGRYRILGRLGEGGMGVVYEAEQDNPKRHVALKVVRAVSQLGGGGQMRRRFEREVHVLGQLDHPGIARIFEADVTGPPLEEDDVPAGMPYFAMELIHGEPIAEYAARHELPMRKRLELFASVCDAIHYAHGRGVIHRDIKPANVLLDEFGHPRVLDFGVARLAEHDDPLTTLQTHVGQIVGTLAYMSPEQVGGDPSKIDARSDVYSLGVVLFELLAGGGRLPIELAGRPMVEAIRIIQDQEPSRLSSIDAAFRGDVDTIVQKAIEKEKSRRYASAGELAADIRRFLNDEPIVARPISTMYQFRKFARRNKALVGGVAGTIAALAIGLVGMSIYAMRAERHAEEAERRQMLAERQTYRASVAGAIAALQNHDIAMARRNLEAAPQPLRGWEWRHLMSRLDDSALTVEMALPSGRDVRRVAWFMPNGRAFAVGTTEGWIAPWDGVDDGGKPPITKMPQRIWTNASATACAWISDDPFHFDIENLLTGERRSWRIATEDGDGMQHWCVFPAEDGRSAVVDRFPASGNEPAPQDFWKEPDHVELVYIDFETAQTWTRGGTIYSTRWEADVHSSGAVVMYNSELISIAQIWRPRIGELIDLRGHTSSLTHAGFNQDGSMVVTTSRDGTVRLWDARSGEPLAVGRGHRDVRFAAFNPAGDLLATCGRDRNIRLWSVPSLEPISVLIGHEAPVHRLAFSADGTRLLSLCDQGVARIWPVGRPGDLEPHVLRGHISFVYPVIFSPDGSMIASGGWDNTVRLWDAQTREAIRVLEGCTTAVYTLAFSPTSQEPQVESGGPEGEGGSQFVAARCFDEIRIWDVASGEEVARLDAPATTGAGCREIAFHPTLPLLFLGWDLTSDSPRGRYFNPMTGKTVIEPLSPSPHQGADMVSPEGRTAWRTAGWPEVTLSVIDLMNGGRLLWEIQISPHVVPMFVDERRLLLVPTDALQALVLDAHTGERLGTLVGHADHIYGLAVSPDGSRFVTCGGDQTIRLWDSQTYEELAQLQGHGAYVWSVAFSPDGATLISGSGDGTVRLWDTYPRSKLTRSSTLAE